MLLCDHILTKSGPGREVLQAVTHPSGPNEAFLVTNLETG